jgi:N-acetylglutamate synthase-like GNAT family acetyltransferase
VLHINLRDGFRNQGIGSRLIAIYLNYLNREEIPGVHLATMSDKAKDFFQKRGFNLLYTGRRSYFNYILHNDIPIYILGRRLP